MFVRELISFAPSLRESGASEVLVPPLALPQIAQSSRAEGAQVDVGRRGDPSWRPPASEPPPPPSVTVAHCANSEVLPAGSVAVALTTSPGATVTLGERGPERVRCRSVRGDVLAADVDLAPRRSRTGRSSGWSRSRGDTCVPAALLSVPSIVVPTGARRLRDHREVLEIVRRPYPDRPGRWA